ncbi:efflux RND transporter periplasmic adaptor subunit [Acidomonas methanolica]|uniref:efflux RND transporter periplasmic adaptor subunit n=1 Tax=Acidomonas methanolica TaxID=437 RepID=UPI00211A9B2B|nr:efflux RND transporter periplasmic adaptor subunit [Acidomonas methanolica]
MRHGRSKGRAGLMLAVLSTCAFLDLQTAPSARAEGAPADAVVTLGAAARQEAGLEIRKAAHGALARPIDAMGMLIPPPDRMVKIQPAGSGKVLTVDVLPGQKVKRGQILLTYQDHSLHLVRLQVAKAKAALASAQTNSAEAQAAYNRAKLLSGQVIAMGEVKRRLALAQAAADELTARQADLATLRHQLNEEYNSVTEADNRSETSDDETSRLLSPVAGEVQSIPVAVADNVEPTQIVATVVDFSRIWIAADVLPQDAERVDPTGMQESVAPDGTRLRSPILSIAAAADPATGLVRVLSRADNSSGALRPGMMLHTTLPSRETVPGIILPADAVMTIDGRSVVFVPVDDGSGTDGRFRMRPVEVGLETPDQAVIVSGLKPGEAVVTHGAFALKSVLLMGSHEAGEG